jgi:hypothetical protein
MKKTRRLLMGLLVALLWLGFIVDGSQALYSKQIRLNGNTVTTGTSDLLISNSQNASSTIYEQTRPGFALSLVPGQSADRFFLVKNASQGLVDFRLYSSAVIHSDSTGNLTQNVALTFTEVDSDGVAIGQPFTVSMTELANNIRITPFTVVKGEVKRFRLTTHLSPGVTTENAVLNYDLVIEGSQVFNN